VVDSSAPVDSLADSDIAVTTRSGDGADLSASPGDISDTVAAAENKANDNRLVLWYIFLIISCSNIFLLVLFISYAFNVTFVTMCAG